MKRWLLYILIPLACMWLSSCQNDVMMLDEGDGKVEVHLKIAISGGDGTTSRAFEDDGFDDNTTLQKSMAEGDIFVLVFQNDLLIDQVKGLQLEGTDGDNHRELVGKFERPTNTNNIELVVLANLIQNDLANITGNNTLSSIQNTIDTWKGNSPAEVYQQLIYQYKVSSSTSNWNINNRRIPMWGTTGKHDYTKANQMNTNCNLHRAVAKLGFRVNNGDGCENLIITGIEISGTMNKGYCASTALLEDDYFISPVVPTNAASQELTYSGLNVTKEYENQIYLPEQIVTPVTPLTITIAYELNKIRKTATINFDENVIRNYSYIYNITVKNEWEISLSYDVCTWENGGTIEVPSFD